MLTSAPARIGEFYHRPAAIPSLEEAPKLVRKRNLEVVTEGSRHENYSRRARNLYGILQAIRLRCTSPNSRRWLTVRPSNQPARNCDCELDLAVAAKRFFRSLFLNGWLRTSSVSQQSSQSAEPRRCARVR